MSISTPETRPNKPNGHSHLAAPISSALDSLRSRIRLYVWTQGLALILAWLGLAFWISLAIDWLPVPFGNDEPGVGVRVGILLVVGAVVVYLFTRYILQRTMVPLRDRNMAVLLERRFREFDDSLLTTVELTAEPTHAETFNREMLDRTRQMALTRASDVRVGDVLDPGPRMLAVILAIVLLGSVAAFAVAAPDSFQLWFQRAVLLQDKLWPRRNHIEVDGDQIRKVARGEDVTIRVLATTEGGKTLPSNVRMEFVNEDGVEGGTNLDRRAEQDGTQEFTHTIYGMLSSIKYDVIGGDYRVRNYEIQVVDRPTVQLSLACQYPEYMRNPETNEFPFPEKLPVNGVMEIPRGTKVTVIAEANKPLQAAYRLDQTVETEADESSVSPAASSTSSAALVEIPLLDELHFQIEIDRLETDQLIQLSLLDQDQIATKAPIRLTIISLPDEPPTVDARLRGIGTAITPDVLIPVVGEMNDRYGLKRAFWDLVVTSGETERAKTQIDFNSFRAGRSVQQYGLDEPDKQQESLDIRQLRRDEIRKRNADANRGQNAPPAGDNSDNNSGDGSSGGNNPGDGSSGLLSFGPQPAPNAFMSDSPDGNSQDNNATQDDTAQTGNPPDQLPGGNQTGGEQQFVDPTNPFQLVPGETVQLTIVAVDACTLDGEPNQGRSQVFTLEVVTPERLRAMLAGRELALRKRFEEQIIVEFDGSIDLISGLDFKAIEAAPTEKTPAGQPQSENFLLHLRDKRTSDGNGNRNVLGFRTSPPQTLPLQTYSLLNAATGGRQSLLMLLQPPGQQPPGQQQPDLEPGERPRQFRQKTQDELMLQAEADVREVVLRSQKNANEIVGIAEGFEDILLEFTNNRVADSEELTKRIRDNIAVPLRNIGENMFPSLDEKLVRLQENLNNKDERGRAALEAEQYMAEIDDAMQTVLSHMMQLESYEELVELMRQIIETQDTINRDTGTYRREQIFGGDK